MIDNTDWDYSALSLSWFYIPEWLMVVGGLCFVLGAALVSLRLFVNGV